MSFKTHLIIVAAIIVAILTGWQFMSRSPAPAPVATPPQDARFTISIARASWGMNCVQASAAYDANGNPLPPQDNFADSAEASRKRWRENNVLTQVSSLCKGKVSCAIPLRADVLGIDPSPQCSNKALEVEYRCFAFDRPWKVVASSGSLIIDCSRREQ